MRVMVIVPGDKDSEAGKMPSQDLLEKMTRFVIWLLDRGYLVRVLMGDEADRRAIDDLLAAVRARRPDDPTGDAPHRPDHVDQFAWYDQHFAAIRHRTEYRPRCT